MPQVLVGRTGETMQITKSNQWMQQFQLVMRDPESRNISCFLALNFSFMIIQMLYGLWTNSLGLISDSIHMLFDCLALVIGLVAAIISKWPATRRYPFGFAKFEIIAGFINGVSLLLVSVSIVVEALERLREPPEMTTDQLLLVSTLGLLVNLVGIMAFNHGHGHSHSHDAPEQVQPTLCQTKSHTHNPAVKATQAQVNPSSDKTAFRLIAVLRSVLHFLISISGCTSLLGNSRPLYSKSKKESTHVHLPTIYEVKQEPAVTVKWCTDAQQSEAHLHADCKALRGATSGTHKHEHSHNMHGVFLHVLADTLGSVGVIVSTLLYKQTGWPGFDPLASIFIAVLIFCSVVPLVTSTTQDLVAMSRDQNEVVLREVLDDISRLRSVHSMSGIRFWYHAGDTDKILGEVTIHVRSNTGDATNSVQQEARTRLESVLPDCHGVNFNVLSTT